MFQRLFNTLTGGEKTTAVENLFAHSTPSTDFYLMIVLSVLMATFGLLADSSAVIVGSMLIAPILYPTLGLAMGMIMSDLPLTSKSFATLFKATLLAIVVSALVTLLFSSQIGQTSGEILARTKPSLLYAAIGVIAGFAAAFAMAKPKLSETLPGVAISVALVPPLAVVGIGLARFDINMATSSLLLFIINAAGVVFAAATVFSLMNFYIKRTVAEATVKEEEKKIEQVEERAETSAK
ncbi:TIGR00341 family protein [Candidatus Kaiserbacteria bacterium CG10_big_fil_rev_8_21_14_0_10_56_12]|uniref:TIGR00341 family protein n=1 Tax=Candidatus Kaiserbacteria bacterium CG10_big_fil_rev_8_21_14_0_10_56_12 TaxID=1974611 RepID=A0A2H0UA98_9BACT|nr:MAG: TIGR00341 family protein [Candidatus Kaiserbacteria bacterium CG10_big_fil_rev_8_21_14_0_10_56_12]